MRSRNAQRRHIQVRKASALLGAGVVAATALAACTTSSSPGSSGASSSGASNLGPSDATLTVAMGADTGGTDPVNPASGPPSNPIRENTVEMLFDVENGQIVPKLAKSYTLSANHLTYTITLKPGIKFQDGTPFNAAAVKWSLDRAKDPRFTGISVSLMKPISSVVVVNNLTVQIKVSKPTPDLPGLLTTAASAMLSPSGVNKDGNTYLAYNHPIGTGPYSFVERIPDEEYVFTRFDGYWGPKPYYKTIDWKIVPDPATAESMVLAGEADVAANPPVADLAALSKNPQVTVLNAPTARLIGIYMNTQSAAFKDIRVREALNYAVDKAAIVKTVLAGEGTVAGSPVASSINPSCTLNDPWPYDPAKAKQLLAAAGATHLSLTLNSPNGRYLQDTAVAQAVAGYLRAVGVTVTVNVLETAKWLEATNAPLSSAGAGFTLVGIVIPYPDAGRALSQDLPAAEPPNGTNASFLDDPTVNASYASANQYFTNPQRAQAFCQTTKDVWAAVPQLYLYDEKYPLLVRSSVKGVKVEFDEKVSILGAYQQS